jgi:hypothetical protein
MLGVKSYWVRANLPPAFSAEDEDPSPPPPSAPRKKSSGPRFVEPYRLGEAQRAALLNTLEAESLGDDDSRQIFLAAIEFDLAGCKTLLEANTVAGGEKSSVASPANGTAPGQDGHGAPLPVAVESLPPMAIPMAQPAVLHALGNLARQLALALADLDQEQRQALLQGLEASDCLARGYGDRYLDVLRLELEHLGATVALADSDIHSDSDRVTATGPLVEPPPPAAPPLPPEVRVFLRRAADAFGDCFDAEPSSAAGTPFPRILSLLGSLTGLPLPEDEITLNQILKADS